jgi:hypothetical protein
MGNKFFSLSGRYPDLFKPAPALAETHKHLTEVLQILERTPETLPTYVWAQVPTLITIIKAEYKTISDNLYTQTQDDERAELLHQLEAIRDLQLVQSGLEALKHRDDYYQTAILAYVLHDPATVDAALSELRQQATTSRNQAELYVLAAIEVEARDHLLNLVNDYLKEQTALIEAHAHADTTSEENKTTSPTTSHTIAGHALIALNDPGLTKRVMFEVWYPSIMDISHFWVDPAITAIRVATANRDFNTVTSILNLLSPSQTETGTGELSNHERQQQAFGMVTDATLHDLIASKNHDGLEIVINNAREQSDWWRVLYMGLEMQDTEIIREGYTHFLATEPKPANSYTLGCAALTLHDFQKLGDIIEGMYRDFQTSRHPRISSLDNALDLIHQAQAIIPNDQQPRFSDLSQRGQQLVKDARQNSDTFEYEKEPTVNIDGLPEALNFQNLTETTQYLNQAIEEQNISGIRNYLRLALQVSQSSRQIDSTTGDFADQMHSRTHNYLFFHALDENIRLASSELFKTAVKTLNLN